MGSSSICNPRCPPFRYTGLGQRRLVDRDRHPLFLCERADGANMISGQPFGIGRPHHVRGLAGKRRRVGGGALARLAET
jgi:hypothetical protein